MLGNAKWCISCGHWSCAERSITVYIQLWMYRGAYIINFTLYIILAIILFFGRTIMPLRAFPSRLARIFHLIWSNINATTNYTNRYLKITSQLHTQIWCDDTSSQYNNNEIIIKKHAAKQETSLNKTTEKKLHEQINWYDSKWTRIWKTAQCASKRCCNDNFSFTWTVFRRILWFHYYFFGHRIIAGDDVFYNRVNEPRSRVEKVFLWGVLFNYWLFILLHICALVFALQRIVTLLPNFWQCETKKETKTDEQQ